MKRETKKFFVSVLVGIFLCSMVIGIGASVYKQHKRIKKILKTQVFAVFKAPSRSSLVPAEDVYPNKPIKITVNPHKKIAEINPNIYGSNLVPHAESERDIIEYIKDTGFTIFRFPGISGYHWKTGKSDFTSRSNKAPLGQIDYLIEFCRLTGTKLLIQVNIESGAPEEAAEWVDYMNNQKGFRVDYWQLGDEVFGDWDKGYMSAKKYAQVIKEYAKAMKKVDPKIKIGMDWAPNSHDEKFNIDVLKGAGKHIDFIAYHWYPNHVGPGHIYKKRIRPTPKEVMANPLHIPAITQRMRELLAKYVPSKKDKIEITFTGWDGAWDGPNFDDAPHSEGVIQWSLANGIFHGETLAQLAESNVSVSNQYLFQDINFGTIRGWDKLGGWGGSRWDGLSIRPKGLAYKLMSNFFRGETIQTQVNNSPYYHKVSDWWPDSYAGEVPFISSYASISDDQSICTLVLFNKHNERDFPVSIRFEKGKPHEAAELYVLGGRDLRSTNERNHRSVQIKRFLLKNIKKEFRYNVPARSMNVIRFRLGGV